MRLVDRILGHASHGCAVCRSDCAEVDRLRATVTELEREVMRLAYALVQEREIRGFARDELEARFPRQAA